MAVQVEKIYLKDIIAITYKSLINESLVTQSNMKLSIPTKYACSQIIACIMKSFSSNLSYVDDMFLQSQQPVNNKQTSQIFHSNSLNLLYNINLQISLSLLYNINLTSISISASCTTSVSGSASISCTTSISRSASASYTTSISISASCTTSVSRPASGSRRAT